MVRKLIYTGNRLKDDSDTASCQEELRLSPCSRCPATETMVTIALYSDIELLGTKLPYDALEKNTKIAVTALLYTQTSPSHAARIRIIGFTCST
jgi:hypothetical protein